MSRWTHVVEADHEVDPHYQPNGLPSYWVCYTCRTEVRLDGEKVPIVETPKRRKTKGEPPMSSQP